MLRALLCLGAITTDGVTPEILVENVNNQNYWWKMSTECFMMGETS